MTGSLRLVIAAVSLATSLWFLAAEHRAGAFGFPLDDSWIHARFAENLATGHGFSFNPGEPSTGSTAPLWSLVLAGPIALGFGPVAGSKALGILFALLTAVLAAELAWALSRSTLAGTVAGLATACSARLVWGAVSGMEVPLYTAATLFTLVWFVTRGHDRGWIWGVSAGLATLARPETGVLFPILAACALWQTSERSTARRGVAQATVAFVAIVGAMVAVNLMLSGRPLPATFYAKTSGAGVLNGLAALDVPEIARSLLSRPLGTLNQFVRFAFEQSALLFLLVLPGLLAAVRRAGAGTSGLPVALVLLLSPVLVGALAPVSPYLMQEGRYVAHLLALFFVVAAVGAHELATRYARPGLVWGIAALAVVRLLAQAVAFAPQYAAQVDNINRMHVAMGRWLAAHTPSGASIAVSDIGALGYFSHRRIVDLEGLVTPSILPYRAGRRYVEFVDHERPDLLVIFPEWYPELVARADRFREVHRITVPRVTAAHDSMVVYATPWTTSPIVSP
jgi:hypothetical protein